MLRSDQDLAEQLLLLTPSDAEAVADAIVTAVEGLLAVHQTTGIDLTQWQEMLPLIRLVHPKVLIEGTGPTREHTVYAPSETGQWWAEAPFDETGA